MATPPDFVAGSVLTAAQLNQIGAWRTKAETSFSAASTVSADNVFTADFTNYKILFRWTNSAAADPIFKLRVGGVAASTNYNIERLTVDSTTVSGVRETAQTYFLLGGNTNGAFNSAVEINLFGPQLATATNINSNQILSSGAYTTPVIRIHSGNHSTTTSYDGFEISVTVGTITGNYAVYGWNQ